MKQLVQKLNDEYARFQFHQLEDLKECTHYICSKQANIEEYIQVVEYQKKINKKEGRLSGFLLYVPLVTVFKTPDFYQEDSLDIDLSIQISVDYLNYYHKLLADLTDNNYMDIAKLTAFMSDLYDYNIHQLESNRASRERFYYGEEEFGVCELINKGSVDEFFQRQINLLCKKDNVEKVKK